MKTAVHIITALIVLLAASYACDAASSPLPSAGRGLQAQAKADVLVTIRVTDVALRLT